MKIRVDRVRCGGIGMCEMTAPTVFKVGDDGAATVINENPSEDERAQVEEAVSNCPTGALSIED
ncbi:ferredoxin [Mycolicibacterium elephantis]|jgi:ferredoxin|uniref:Ferredoxin n=1 Tax=Mycolicibacterium elephantis DSM 44368 TaxID=1335622 RepID=A0A439DRG1_9MYCO|nr:ferredoxin [Mycolicibacterium elephantis]MCV7221737.1 ferredoxin [Mycolicibacterium elephantis]RWA18791.1 hypothetical protein MELE44368_03925 [Mycolicibacterium elephantis DSM 44368]